MIGGILNYIFKQNCIYGIIMETFPELKREIYEDCVKKWFESKVQQTVSAERGTNVTILAFVNAACGYVPPVFIFPRKKVLPLIVLRLSKRFRYFRYGFFIGSFKFCSCFIIGSFKFCSSVIIESFKFCSYFIIGSFKFCSSVIIESF
ncbi:hypothetical protein DAPPUDRAFT_332529 [Daphnia pulex]|uniref:Uncharacterized protein n=1 Tax=Daphnia pulex TaxID=6669 RepID=E9HQ81_DAPPU|nr:hypothetical protein DAPPUDRAFT_332529 [Daphnia pulex]|eukprot:EFX66103.1 hypothetical protein DAPPUDRAFT_332529 [Daphnia pulex]